MEQHDEEMKMEKQCIGGRAWIQWMETGENKLKRQVEIKLCWFLKVEPRNWS